MRRAHSYKDKTAKGIEPTMGLMSYPILMAADILIYRSHLVPVGKDQVQHIEMTQDIAARFNSSFNCDVLIRPEAKLNRAPLVPGVDGEKMSKSYGNTIDLFDEPSAVRKRIMSMKTDSTPVDEPKNPDRCNVYAIYSLLARPEEAAEVEAAYRKGGMGYGEVKKRLFDVYERIFGPARERRAILAADADRVEDVLRDGARRARRIACEVMEEVRKVTGIVVGGNRTA